MRSHVDANINPANSNKWDEIGEYTVHDSVDKAVSNCIIYKRIKDHSSSSSSVLYEIYIFVECDRFDSFHYFRNSIQIVDVVIQYGNCWFCVWEIEGNIGRQIFVPEYARLPETSRVWIEKCEEAKNYRDEPGWYNQYSRFQFVHASSVT